MIFTISWLKEYIDFDLSPEDLAHRLTMAGLEVEAIEYQGRNIDSIVTAQILDTRPHPNADKLTLCDVTDGETNYDIVCGATNMKTGDKVALATVGTMLPPSPKFPEGLKIKKAKIRGETSLGMLCAANELGLGEEGDGIIILPESTKVGSKLVEELGLDDVVFEIGITPNRPDCLSLVGVAREVAAILGKEVKYPKFQISEEGPDINELTQVELLDPEKCPRYSCRVIQNVKIGPSPQWLKTRLESSDIRSINNVVDVTNYVLLELGQPLHAFDYDLLADNKIVVRHAKDGETIKTLDDVERKLLTDDLLICDGQNPVALAGLMGGADTEVSDKTTNVLLESAYFDPTTVRKTSKHTGLRSESSYRFERGVDPNGVTSALDRAAELIRELSGGTVARWSIDQYPDVIEPNEVTLSLSKANALLGTDIKSEDIIRISKGLGFEILDSANDVFKFSIPTYRVDITREIDLIEEVARLYGYDNIATRTPTATMKTETLNPEKLSVNKFKEIFISRGFYEVINYSFEDPELLGLFKDDKTLSILNPLTAESSAMRTSLLPGIVKNAVLNLNHQAQDIRLFEIGKSYIPQGSNELPREITQFAATVTGRRNPEFWDKEDFDFFDLKSILESCFEALLGTKGLGFQSASEIEFLHPGKSGVINFNDDEIGYIGELHPELVDKLDIPKSLYVCEIDLNKVSEYSSGKEKSFSPLPKFPSVRRDIALVVDDGVAADEILGEIGKSGSKLIEEANVFDVFTGGSVEQGKKSVAVSLQLRAADKTLTEEEINKVQDKTLKKLQSALGAELRTT